MTRAFHPIPGHSRIRCNIPGPVRAAESDLAGARPEVCPRLSLLFVSLPDPATELLDRQIAGSPGRRTAGLARLPGLLSSQME